jgi:tape measure domain-containing protein
MASEFVVRIKVDASGGTAEAKRFERGLDSVKDKALDLNRTLRQVFGVFAIKEAAEAIYGLVEGYSELQNRLRQVAKDQDNLNGLTNETFKIAQATRSSFETTAKMYARWALNSREVGVSQKQLMEFTKSLNQEVIVSGATSQEASAGLIQLSQGMASGTLRGDELRSVLEQLPGVADVIAKHFNITRGQLRQWGTDGKLVAKDIIAAFHEQRDEIDANFNKTVPTMAQGMTMLTNAAQKFFGEMATGEGVLGGVASMLIYVANHFDTFGHVIIAFAEVIGVRLVIYGIGRAITALQALATAALANPFTALLYAVVAVIAVLRQFGDQMDAGTGNGTKVSAVLHVIWQDMKDLGAAIYDFLSGAWSGLMHAFSAGMDESTGGIKLTFRNVLLFLASFVDAAIDLLKFLGKSIVTVFGGIPAAVGEMFIDLARKIAEIFGAMINKVLDGYNAVRNATGTLTGSKTRGVASYYADEEKKFHDEVYSQWMSPNHERLKKAFALKDLEGKNGDAFDAALNKYSHEAFGQEGIRSALGMQPLQSREDVERNATGQVGHVDLSFTNPLKGSYDAVGEKFSKDLEESLKGRDVSKYIMGAFDRAAGVKEEKPTPGTVGGDVGMAGPHIPSQKEITAWMKLWRELQSVMAQSNPMTEAQLKYAKAVDVSTQAMAAGMIGFDEYLKIIIDTANKTADARDPLAAWTHGIEEEINEMQLSRNEMGLRKEVFQEEQKIREKGFEIDERAHQYIREEVELLRGERAAHEADLSYQHRRQEMQDSILQPQAEYADKLKILDDLHEDNAISADRYAHEVDKVKTAYAELNASPETKMLHDSLKEGFNQATDALVNFIVTGKGGFDSLAESLEKMLVKLVIIQTLQAAFGGGSGDVGGIITKAMFGFASGGSFKVGGAGGTDSQLVAFRASPNETVTVTRPDQQSPHSGGGGGNGSAPVSIHNHLHLSPDELLRGVDSARGESVVTNIIHKRHGAALALRSRGRL